MSQIKPSKKVKLSPEEYRAKAAELQEMEDMLALKQGLPHLFGYPFYNWTRRVFESKNKEILLTAANQVGKAQCVETMIPTPMGFKKMGDLVVGDYVFGQDGKPARIIDIPFEGDAESYEIAFNDGSSVIASNNHLWITKGYRERFRKSYTNNRAGSKKFGKKFLNEDYGKWQVKTTLDIIKDGDYLPETGPVKRHSIPVSKEVYYEHMGLFDPYIVGVHIGDGHSGVFTVNSDDKDIISAITKHGNLRGVHKPGSKTLSIEKKILSPHVGNWEARSFEKEIPPQYLMGSIEERKALLRGLMDTDGFIDKRGQHYSYSTTSKKLASQVLELTCSLGGFGHIKQSESYYKKNGKRVRCRNSYKVTIWTRFNPFQCKRKASRWNEKKRYKFERVITSIKSVGRKKSRCITVDNDDGSFLCTKDYIVTHNSSSAIRRNIHLATSPKLWPEYWPHLPPDQPPGLFWYMYPTLPVATTEVEEKWVKEFLPRGEYKDHPQFGWKLEYHKNEIHSIVFNSGVTIQFKAYSQKIKDLQTASVYHLTCDEELPVDYLPELKARLNATDGYFLTVFTATLGQLFWKQAMEPISKDEERFPDALKIQVSLYDSMKYEDGSPSPWTEAKIKRAIANCPTESEVQRRIYGRFVKSEGLMYEGFSLETNLTDKHALPKNWEVFSGVDPGSGGKSGHPAAIVFLAVDPTYTKGRVFRGWRGDGIPTTSEDILIKHTELKGSLKLTAQVYDYAAKDFFMIAGRAGEAFTPADKGRDRGVGVLNTLFKSGVLKIQRGDPELDKLVSELTSLSSKTPKTAAIDDMVDALRYAAMAVPWDFSQMMMPEDEKKEHRSAGKKPRFLTEAERRKEWFLNSREQIAEPTVEDELDFWGDLF